MIYILIFILGILIIASPTVRCIVFHPFSTIMNASIDTFLYFKHKKWNEAPYGKIIGYIADSGKKFGCGKTLTGAKFLTEVYKQYNDNKVWCSERKKFVTQKIVILSNIALKKVPYIDFVSFKQYTSLLEERYLKDKEEDTLTVIYAYIDEASCLLNSRGFRENLDPIMIQSLLTCRHYHSSLYYSSQKSKLVDALLRSVTSYYIGCDKLWRLQRIHYYDADELEYATNPTIVKPYRSKCWFIKNKHFEYYNTYELLKTIDKKYKDGDMMTEDEILAHLQMPEPNVDGVINTSKKFKKSRKKMMK